MRMKAKFLYKYASRWINNTKDKDNNEDDDNDDSNDDDDDG